MNKNIILEVLEKNNKKGFIPIWLMRQAGRYLPEYRSVRGGISRFMDLCYNSEIACQVTMQPIERFGFDAAILFSDILIVPDKLGLNVRFETGHGPVLSRIEKKEDLRNLYRESGEEKYKKIWKTVSLIKEKLPKEVGLIGFAGAPWTVATYMLEGGKSNFEFSKKIAKEEPEFLSEMIDILVDETIIYLEGQIDAGANIIQLFDSWAGILPEKEYIEFVEKPNKRLVDAIRKSRPNIPIICFPKGVKYLESFVDNVSPDGLSIDYNVDLELAKKLKEKTVIQGNLDPKILASSREEIKAATENILTNLAGGNFIFNLGHGILPETPVENVEFLVNLVRQYEKNSCNII